MSRVNEVERHEEVECSDCDFVGWVYVLYDGGETYWECPTCLYKHEGVA